MDLTRQSDLLRVPADPSLLLPDLVLLPASATPRDAAVTPDPVDFINCKGAGLVLWAELVSFTGDAALASLKLQAKIGAGYVDLASVGAGFMSALSGAGTRATWLYHPVAFTSTPFIGKIQTPVPRQLRIVPALSGTGVITIAIGCSFLAGSGV